MNKIQIMGYLTKDPILKTAENGNQFCVFTVAVKRRFTKDNDADFFPCIAFGKNSGQIARNFGKGRMIGISGTIKTELINYDNQKRFCFSLLVEEWHIAGDLRRKVDLNGGYRREDIEDL